MWVTSVECSEMGQFGGDHIDDQGLIVLFCNSVILPIPSFSFFSITYPRRLVKTPGQINFTPTESQVSFHEISVGALSTTRMALTLGYVVLMR